MKLWAAAEARITQGLSSILGRVMRSSEVLHRDSADLPQTAQ